MPACMRTWRSVSHARSSWRSCSGACTHAAMETVRAARMCARAPGDAPAVRSGISWRGCSTQRLWSMHTRCHGDSTQPLACVRACAPDDQQPCSSHTRTTQPFFFLQVEVEPPFSPPASLRFPRKPLQKRSTVLCKNDLRAQPPAGAPGASGNSWPRAVPGLRAIPRPWSVSDSGQ